MHALVEVMPEAASKKEASFRFFIPQHDCRPRDTSNERRRPHPDKMIAEPISAVSPDQ
jgi:hypothetical protein